MSLVASEIVSYDDVNKVIDVEALFVESTPTGPAEDKFTLLFKQVGSSWLLFGNQQLGVLYFSVESRTDNTKSGNCVA